MKSIAILLILIAMGLLSNAQSSGAETLQELEQGNLAQLESSTTATMSSASRLFGDKYDLTSVILIIPSGSTVMVLDSDSTYFHVVFEEYEGYIFKRHAEIDDTPVSPSQDTQNQQFVQEEQPVQEGQPAQVQQLSRFSYLENKYGSSMAARLISGKIWKGMNSEMVKDSWGTALKINRVISGNIIKEEWIFKYTWLYFENNTLVEWGPIKQ